MSVIESLLGPHPGAHAGKPVHAIRTLLVHDDVLIHLQEDEGREEVTLYSRPGWMQLVDWPPSAPRRGRMCGPFLAMNRRRVH